MTKKQTNKKALKQGSEGVGVRAIRYTLYAIRSTKGLSLVETLLYTLIVGIVVSGFLLFIYSVITAAERSQGNMELADAKLFIEQKLEWVMQGASAINVPGANATGGTLTVTKTNFAENPVTIDSVGGVVRVQTSVVLATPLTPSEVTISNLSFNHIVSGTHERLRTTGILTGRFATTGIDQTIILK